MKKLLMILAVAAVIGCCASCSHPVSGPAKVADKAMAAIQNSDWKAYAETFDIPEEQQSMIAGLAEEKIEENNKARGGIKSYTITDTEIEEDGNSAIVSVNIVYGDGTEEDENLSFKKNEDGEWKQHIDK